MDTELTMGMKNEGAIEQKAVVPDTSTPAPVAENTSTPAETPAPVAENTSAPAVDEEEDDLPF